MAKPASYYTGAKLIAKQPVTVVTSPNGTLVRIVQPGEVVGTIYSYVDGPGGVWWQLTDNTFTKHEPGKFDAQIANDSSDGLRIQKFYDDVQTNGFIKAVKDATPALKIGGGIILGVVVLILVVWLTQNLKTLKG